MFDLDRSWTEKKIKQTLSAKQAEIIRLKGAIDPNDISTRNELQETLQILRDAIKILGKIDSRQAYDIELKKAIEEGNISHEFDEVVEDILVKARNFLENGKYHLAVELANEALEKNKNQSEPYEILSQANYMLGNYDEALKIIQQGTYAFQNDITLRWLETHYFIMIEDYNKAQLLLNTAMNDFANNSVFLSEQVYLYYYLDKDELGKKKISEYINKYPNDNELRRLISYNLIEIAQQSFLYDSASDMYLLTEEHTYNRCLELTTLANQIYQDETTKSELEYVKQFGEKVFDEDHKTLVFLYGGLGIAAIILSLVDFFKWSLGAEKIFIIISIIFFLLAFVVRQISYRPYWKVYRDMYRGFKESDDSVLYTILSIPLEIFNFFK